MRRLHDYTTSAYLAFTMAIIMALIIVLTGESLTFTGHFNTWSWVLMIVSAFLGIYASIFRFKALQYETASKLAVFNYFTTVL